MSTLTDQISSQQQLTFVAWDTPLAAFDADSDDAIVFLAPVIGPTSVVLLFQLAMRLRHADEITVDVADLAHSCGVGRNENSSLLRRSLLRLELFGYLRFRGGRCEVRTKVPPLSHRHVAHLPAYLQAVAPAL
ncbi:MAG: hypothetical protein ACRD0G_06225 [Acidimicrobiales bacterium]